MVSFFSSYCILSSFCFIGFGVFCVLKNRASVTNRLWFLASMMIGIWAFGVGMMVRSSSLEEAQVWLTVLCSSAILIPPTFLHYIYSLVKVTDQKRKIIISWYVFFAALLIVNFFKPDFFARVSETKPNFPYFTDLAPLYPVFTVAFVVCVAMAFIALIVALRSNISTANRNQLKYMLLASIFGFGGGITAFFPVYDLPIYPFGVFIVITYPVLMAYAIVRHRLLDIEVMIKRTLVFAGLSFFVLAAFAVPFYVVTNMVGFSATGQARWLLLALIGIGITAVFRPLDQFLVHVTDKFLFQKKINYRILLKEASEYLAHVESMKKQARRSIAFLIKKARIANASVYVFTSSDPTGLRLEASRPSLREPDVQKIKLTHSIIQYLYRHKGPIEISDLKDLTSKAREPKESARLREILALLKATHSEAVIPCFGGEAAASARGTGVHLRGILFLGHQKSDEPYTEEDLDVFFTLGQESSIAFENARLYDEAINKSRELERINSELGKAQNELIEALRETGEANRKLQITQASLIVAEKKATMVGVAQSIAHEVNNPLSIATMGVESIYKKELKTCREIVGEVGHLIPEQALNKLTKSLANIDHYARRVEFNGRRIEGVVRSLTDLMKQSRGELAPIELRVLCQAALEQTRFSTYTENLMGCDINLSEIKPNVRVMGSSEQLLQVFVNLIKNAFEAMGEQPKRRIDITGDYDPENPRMARVEFSDNGPGIHPDVLTKIWRQGFTTKKKTETSGHGQGLFVCKHIVESLHGGSIHVESALGKGTTFIIKLPLAGEKRDGQYSDH